MARARQAKSGNEKDFRTAELRPHAVNVMERVLQGDSEALREIGRIGEPAIEAVLAAAESPFPDRVDLRDGYAYLSAAVQAACRRSVRVLIKRLADQDLPRNFPLTMVCSALGRSSDRRASNPLLELARHREPHIRAAAIEALANRREPRRRVCGPRAS